MKASPGRAGRDAAPARRTDAAGTRPRPLSPAWATALQRAAGNAAVADLLGRRVLARAPGPLTPQEERASFTAGRALLGRTPSGCCRS